MKTSKLIILWMGIALSLASPVVSAGIGVVFNNPFLVAIQSGNNLYGYYDSENERFSCVFFFYGKSNSPMLISSNHSSIEIDTFGFGLDPKSYAYQGRSKYSDIPGTLFSDSNGWVIKTDSPPDACNGIGADFSKSPSDANFSRYYIVEKLNALEIGVVVRKTLVREKIGSNRSKAMLVGGDAVLVISRKGSNSYIRFIDSKLASLDRDPVVTGWVRSADIANPFPRPMNHD
ncbi:hypothetical protein [Paraburkholderia tropica]|uniref:Uncharacterized protein n=1 Tax=Paraburkholderia tropica TaxID=92647 RepID=A0AAQ1GG16_9BURK|nr:hypothetical protein [Paraburkholderia tropica]QNB15886.1 hypothetical protein G5S35_30470 [Paraburkholderia tropica]RQN39320.1 hypothetical protein EHZ25_08665 [Paraburkholderia tropica]SEJ69934.1 hypothetical protein SAMN05216550_107242 [Paraburkholderia tropica]